MPIRHLDHVNFITKDMPATIWFYTEIIGLVRGQKMSEIAGSEYLYIKGQDRAILHVGDVGYDRQRGTFKWLAIFPQNEKDFTTGILDHVCLTTDISDYDNMINKLNTHKLTYETYTHTDKELKQVWVLDPNGLRVELNFRP